MGNGKLVSVQVSPELFGHFTSSDPDLNQLAKQLIIQAAMEKDSEAECEELPDIPTVPQTPENSPKPTPSGIFTYEQTIFLISAYKERKEKFLSPTHKKKALWLEITEELNKCFKTEFTVAQVEGRWKTQLSAYKRHQTDQAKSGNERKEFLYEEEFQDIFSDRHDINPKFVVSSLSSSSDSGSFTQDEPCTSSSSGEPAGITDPQPKKKRKISSRSNSSQVIHFLEDYVENQNKKNEENMKKIEKMHEEKMKIFSGFLSVFKSMKD